MINQTTERIKKLIKKNPQMSDEEVARKIGRPNEEGRNRVWAIRERIK